MIKKCTQLSIPKIKLKKINKLKNEILMGTNTEDIFIHYHKQIIIFSW